MSDIYKIDYNKLHIGDMVVCGGSGPTAVIIRAATVGWTSAFDKSISVHTGVIVKWAGQVFIAEMLGRGVTLSPPSRYEGKRRRYIMGIRRHPAYIKYSNRAALNRRVSKLYRKSIEYDWNGVLSFVFENCKDDPKRFYCSEFFKHITSEVEYPQTVKSPFDLQCVSGWKYIMEVYRCKRSTT